MLVHFLQSERRKRLDCDVVWCTSVLCTGFKNDVTDTDCRQQNGSTYGCVLGNFNKQGQKSCETFLCTGCCFYSILSERAHDASSAWCPFNRVPTCRQLHHHHHSTNQPYLPFFFFSLTAACYTATSTFMQLNHYSTNQPYLPFFFFSLKPVLNWVHVCSPEHTSDTSTNYDSFLNWTFSSPNMVRTVQTLLHSQLACNEMQASPCGRQHDWKCRLKSSQYTWIIPHRVIQLTTISFWVSETRLCLPQVNKQIPSEVSEKT